jgi:N-acyl-D-amino-acid deacylase
MYDSIIKDAAIIDGTGKDPFYADIGISEGKIATLGVISDSQCPMINAKGCVVAPGFIDMHSHSDLELLRQKTPDAKVRQGITTEVLGQDGLGVAPVSSKDIDLMFDLTAGLLGLLPRENWTWESLDEYCLELGRRKIPNNVAVLASHGPIRIKVMGMDNRPADPRELNRMRGILRETLEAGAFGLSTGLIYPPCSFSTTEELVGLNKEVARRNGIFMVHQRDEGFHLKRSFAEVTEIANLSGVHLHISHLQAFGKINWWLMDEILSRADAFIAKGGKLTWERYPYLAGSTVLTAVLPTWTFSSGTEVLVSSLRDHLFRKAIHDDFKKGLNEWHNRSLSIGWQNIIITAVNLEENRWMQGHSCEYLAKVSNKDPVDFVCDLLADEKLAVTMISHYGSEEVLEKVLSHPHATVGTDGIFGGQPHPRLYGTFPRFLHEFVNTKKILSLTEAIRKITSFPADILGLNRRGIVKEGYWADLVIFDPRSFKDTATYDNPCAYPTGLSFVFVNGQIIVDEKGLTKNLPGHVLNKSETH